MGNGFRTSPVGGIAAPPYTNGPYTFSEHITFASATIVGNEGEAWFVDQTNGSTSNSGKGWNDALTLIQDAIDLAGAGDNIYVTAALITDFTGDPTSYTENLVIGADTPSLSIIGVSRGRTQGGLPQLKVGSTTTQALLTIRAAGCLIVNMGFNGAGATGGGILLDDDYSTKTAFGTSIVNCHFKNCKGPDVDDAKEGGAIQWTTEGNAWQVLISGCRFYKNVADITLMGTTNTRPQDVVIEDCDMSGYAAHTDCNIYAGGSGFGSVKIDNCRFGQLPAIGANVARYMELTGTLSGTVTNCTFGCEGNDAGTALTFKAAGTGANIPVTVHFVKNYGQSVTSNESAELTIA